MYVIVYLCIYELIRRCIFAYTAFGEVGGWGRDPKKCTGRDWGMGVEYHLMKPTPRR